MWFFKRSRASRSPQPQPGVTSTADAIRHTRPDGTTEHLRWSDLYEVGILTTDEGPCVSDVFWMLLDESGKSGCAIPSEAPGMQQLLSRLQKLPGFSNETVILAMGSVDNAKFVCWKRDTK